MDLNFGNEYAEFTKEVRLFCEKYKGLSFVDKNISPLAGSFKSDKDGPCMTRSEWQKLLIDHGYFARSIPKKYGGYGGDSDILKQRIIASEFSQAELPPPMAGQGIDMLVPTLLELGTEEQKEKYIKPTLHGEMIWCQGYSEPNAGSDLASLQTKGELTFSLQTCKITTSIGFRISLTPYHLTMKCWFNIFFFLFFSA